MRLALALVFGTGLLAEAVPVEFRSLATTDDGSVLYFASPSPLLGTGAITRSKIFAFDGQSLRLFAQQDAADLGWMSVSGDGGMVAFNGRVDAGGFQARLARATGSVFWTTAGQAAISHNGRFALFVPGDGTVTITDLLTGSGNTAPADSPFPLTDAGYTIASDGTAVLRGEQEIGIVRNGGMQRFAIDSMCQSVMIDDSATTVAYETAARIFLLDAATGNQIEVARGVQPSLTSDGQHLLYRSMDRQVWIVGRDGTGARQLTSDASEIFEAIISGDGSTAYAVTVDNRILRIDVSSGAVRDITADITAAAKPQARVISFALSPATIGPGGAAQLCYQLANADDVSIQPGFGAVAATSGCLAVSPAVTTTYTLAATRAGYTSTATTTLTVAGNVQIASFTNDPAFSTAAGNPVTLSWTTGNAASVAITGAGVPSGTLPVNGSIVVKPVTNTSYTLSAYGTNGQAVSAVLYVFVR